MKKRNKKGFTLIELLIVVAIIGIIVAIAIPNLLNAIQRAKQKRTMGDMRSAGTAAEAYAVDFNHYPAAAGYTAPTGISVPPAATFGKAGVVSTAFLTVRSRRPTSASCPSRTAGIRGSSTTSGKTQPGLRHLVVRQGRLERRERPVRRDDELQHGHRLHRRPVRSVPRGRAELVVLLLQPDPRAPVTGALFFSGP